MSRPGSLCLYYISVSRPRFDVATSFLLSASLLLSHNFSFKLQHHSVVLSLQAGRHSKLLVYLFSCHDIGIRSRPSSFFKHCNSCRDLKSMSRPFFLPIQSQPHFSVSTVSIQFSISSLDLTVLPFAKIYVATSIPCRDIIVCCLLHFCVATSILCRDIISVVNISFLVTAPIFMLRLKIVSLFIVLSQHGI